MKSIWTLVRQVAADFPVDLATDAGQEKMLTEIMVGCTSELSPVLVDKDKTIVGVLLARRDEYEWGLSNANVVRVTYAAIAPSHKDQSLRCMGAPESHIVDTGIAGAPVRWRHRDNEPSQSVPSGGRPLVPPDLRRAHAGAG